ncbi:MAG: hypothetical protein IPP65_07930 [Chlorobi bacterium]|nr:hypothetical protein [Chlorobiota bacterium]
MTNNSKILDANYIDSKLNLSYNLFRESKYKNAIDESLEVVNYIIDISSSININEVGF